MSGILFLFGTQLKFISYANEMTFTFSVHISALKRNSKKSLNIETQSNIYFAVSYKHCLMFKCSCDDPLKATACLWFLTHSVLWKQWDNVKPVAGNHHFKMVFSLHSSAAAWLALALEIVMWTLPQVYCCTQKLRIQRYKTG